MTDADRNKEEEEAFLVALLLVMTVVTGAVDAVSILRLGRVFVANMTGNVVFLGFALAGTSGFSLPASLVALGAFLGGAAGGGRVLPAKDRRNTVRRTAVTETALVVAAAGVAFASSGPAARYTMTVLRAAAMGAQNAVVRGLAVADLTTTVLTMTLTGLAVDRPRLAGWWSPTRRRAGAVVAMVLGAVAGALLVVHASTGAALVLAAVLLGVVGVAAVWWHPRGLSSSR